MDDVMILVNSFPKSGTHALQKACYVLGVHAEIGHYQYEEKLPPEFETIQRMFFIKRDPRNMIVSNLRYKGLPVCQGSFLSEFRNPEFKLIDRFTPWLSYTGPNVFHTSYEALMESDAELRRIAEFLEVPFLEDAFENIPGHTRTWRLPHSDYEAIWTPTVQRLWGEEGGNEILKEWGYV